jgi:peptidoglycan hydrolase-like protein with peptidoglycan-binding domain
MYANKVVEQAQAWLGKKESNGTHKEIIDVYNSHKPLARGYEVKYTDSWCATFVSAVAIKLGYTSIIPTECGCEKMIELFKGLGEWVEDDAYTPKAGDIIFYDWEDDGNGDNKGYTNHVGIVEDVLGTVITVIEGNYSNSVKRRTIHVNGKNIRGYGVPKYSAEIIDTKINEKVLEWQKAAIADGFEFAKYGADGEWGNECISVAKNAVCKKRIVYKYKNLTKIVQKAVGVTVDGKFGNDTRNAVIKFQKLVGLVDDGCVGLETWKKILNV